jgi:hypothetical protein
MYLPVHLRGELDLVEGELINAVAALQELGKDPGSTESYTAMVFLESNADTAIEALISIKRRLHKVNHYLSFKQIFQEVGTPGMCDWEPTDVHSVH